MDKTLEALGKLPPFSPVLTRVLVTLSGDEVSFGELGELIEKDPVLSGNILNLANSAFYARREATNSVRHASVRLGVKKLQNAILGLSISRLWNQMHMPGYWSMARFNLHAAAAALLSDLLAQRLPVAYPEGAFVAGLLHDLGQLLMVRSLPDEYDQVLRLFEEGPGDLQQCEEAIFGFTHAEASAAALGQWNLPEPTRLAVRFHHNPGLDPASSNRREIPLSRIIAAANGYVNSIGISVLLKNGPADPPDVSIQALGGLGLDAGRLEKLLNEFSAENAAMAQFFR